MIVHRSEINKIIGILDKYQNEFRKNCWPCVIILMGLIIFTLRIIPQPKYQDSISYQLAPNARSLTKDDFEMYVVRVNVFENEENATTLKKNINVFPAYTSRSQTMLN